MRTNYVVSWKEGKRKCREEFRNIKHARWFRELVMEHLGMFNEVKLYKK